MNEPPSFPGNGYGAGTPYGYGAPAGQIYGGYPPGLQPPAPAIASWGRRFVARLIDWVPLYAVMAGLYFLLSYLLRHEWTGLLHAGKPNTESRDLIMIARDLPILAISLIPFVYEWLMLRSKGRTVGKIVMKLQFASAVTRQPLTPRQAKLRAWQFPFLVDLIGAFTCGIFALIDGLWPLWNKPLGQALHDKMAGTIVIRTDVPGGYGPHPGYSAPGYPPAGYPPPGAGHPG